MNRLTRYLSAEDFAKKKKKASASMAARNAVAKTAQETPRTNPHKGARGKVISISRPSSMEGDTSTFKEDPSVDKFAEYAKEEKDKGAKK